MIKVYTDGSYKSSTHRGGYAAVITHNDLVIKVLHEGFVNTTNNRMEIMGVLAALRYYKTPMDIELYSDSSYVVNSINEKHLHKWIEENDETKKKCVQKNSELCFVFSHFYVCASVGFLARCGGRRLSFIK